VARKHGKADKGAGRLQKNYCGMQETQWPTGSGDRQPMNIPQDAQKVRPLRLWFVWFIWFLWLVLFNQTNEINQITVFLRWRTFSAFC
jgi:hypothetical protein